MNDKITLKNAMDEPFWLMVYAGEPTRQIDVTMSYANLFCIYQWYHTYFPKEEK